MDVQEAIEAQTTGWRDAAAVHELIHGTDDPAVIAHQIERWCRDVLHHEVTEASFHAVSAGSVTGVVLDDGTSVVVKAYQPRWSTDFLTAVVATQTALASAGVPCATPIAGPAPLGAGRATAERHLADPGPPASYGPAEMAASARGLAALITAAPWCEALRSHPMNDGDGGGLYPVPHSPIFDFEATAAGAEWIDDLAVRVFPHRAAGPEVVAHMDWSARNVRLGPDGVRAIYDLDSLSIAPLSMAIAGAATTWRSTADPDDAGAPDADEIDAWLDLWPEPLDPTVRAGVFASAVYALAYTARCEHAIDPHGARHQRARPTLRRDAGRYLARAGLD